MTGVSFASLVREYTGTNSTVLPDSKIVLLGNVVKDELAPLVMEADEDIFGVPATRNLVASSLTDFTKREYSLPDDLLAIKSVEAALDGTNWLHLDELDLTKYKRVTDESTVTSIFGYAGNAFYDIFRRSLWIYSGAISALTGGLKLWYIAYPADISAGNLADSTNDLSIDPSTTTSALPRQLQELWARRISILWKSNREKPIPLTERELKYQVDLDKMIGSLKNPNKDRSNLATLPSDSRLQV